MLSNDTDEHFGRKVWVIAMRFEHKGTEQAGAWATIRTDDNPGIADGGGIPGGLTVSVDKVARDRTVWPYGPDTKSGIDADFDGVAEAVECVESGVAP